MASLYDGLRKMQQPKPASPFSPAPSQPAQFPTVKPVTTGQPPVQAPTMRAGGSPTFDETGGQRGGGLAMPGAKPPMPMAQPPGGVPGVAGAAIRPIMPANDLRFQSITPDVGGAGAPDLTSLASGTFKDLLAQNADDRQRTLRDFAGSTAALGRIGYGPNNRAISDIADVFARREGESLRGLASDVARGDLDERRAQRGELRGERDYQVGRSESATDRAIQQRLLEEQLLEGEFGRDVTRTQLGYQGNPAGLQFDAGQDYGRSSDASFDDVGQYLAELGLRRPGATGPASPPYVPPTPRPTTRPRYD